MPPPPPSAAETRAGTSTQRLIPIEWIFARNTAVLLKPCPPRRGVTMAGPAGKARSASQAADSLPRPVPRVTGTRRRFVVSPRQVQRPAQEAHEPGAAAG